MSVLSYRGHPAITKAAFVAEMEAHAAADRIVSGHYWDGYTGCAIGCGLRSILSLQGGETLDPYDPFYGRHKAHAAALGIPRWLSGLQDALFESLPKPRQQSFPVQFAQALPDGANLSNLYEQVDAAAEESGWVPRLIIAPNGGLQTPSIAIKMADKLLELMAACPVVPA